MIDPTRHCANFKLEGRRSSLSFPRPSSDQTLASTRIRPLYPRSRSIPLSSPRFNRSYGCNSNTRSSVGDNSSGKNQPLSYNLSSRRTMSIIGSATIVQRSGSKQIKAMLSEILRLSSEDSVPSSSSCSILASLRVLQQHAVDSYYQVIMRKHGGVEILQEVSKVFASEDDIVGLCTCILNLLLQVDGETTNCQQQQHSCISRNNMLHQNMVDYHVMNFSSTSPANMKCMGGPRIREARSVSPRTNLCDGHL
mmetsp:Transcript_29407/g.48896  ORF Transcript_29407/g.48896 Transcript_29407/m.48896 type:complete len:252 (+) Transcript_29407:108-863(+)